MHCSDSFNRFFSYVCSLNHVRKLANEEKQLNLLPALASNVYKSFKYCIHRVIWEDYGDCRTKWFIPIKGEVKPGQLKGFYCKNGKWSLDDIYELHYQDSTCLTKLNQAAAFASFYTNEMVAKEAGREACIALDVAMGMSGTEAVVESYYSVMNSQQFPGGQSNDTLVQRTNIDWCFPMPLNCEETIKEVAQLYLDGDKETGLAPHRVPVFLDERGRAVNRYARGSKVLNRLASTSHHFVLCEKDQPSNN